MKDCSNAQRLFTILLYVYLAAISCFTPKALFAIHCLFSTTFFFMFLSSNQTSRYLFTDINQLPMLSTIESLPQKKNRPINSLGTGWLKILGNVCTLNQIYLPTRRTLKHL